MESGSNRSGELGAVHARGFWALEEKIRRDLGDRSPAWRFRPFVSVCQQRSNGLPDPLNELILPLGLFLDCPVLANAPEEVRTRRHAHVSGILEQRGKVPHGEKAPQCIWNISVNSRA